MRRRARPLLGTLVEVRSPEDAAARFDRAAEAAFEAVAQVHRLMSFHETDSDLRRLARAGAGQRVRVHPRTATVLRHALRWWRASGGAFDPACAPRAVDAGRLPAPADAPRPDGRPLACALALDGCDVLVHAPVWLDFGGIAKGYAVDRAVAALRRAGLLGGAVNAGGDLRVFGPQEETVYLRSPADPAALWPVATLHEGACATSAGESILATDGAAPEGRPQSVTVFAPTACAADALTKVVGLRGIEAAPLLRRARARALVVRADGRTLRL